MPVPVMLSRPRTAPLGESVGDWCKDCRHAALVLNADGLEVKAEMVRGCAMHERIVIRSGWCEEWEAR